MPAAIAALWSMDGLQAHVLRDAVNETHGWAAITTAARLASVTIPVVAVAALPSGTPPALLVVVAAAAAGAIGVTVGVITGWAMLAIVMSAGS